MREVSVVKDVFRGTPHAIIMREDGLLKFKALTQYAKRFVDSRKDFITLSDINIPDGFVRSDFKKVYGIFDTAATDVFSKEASEYTSILSSASKHDFQRKFIDRHINECPEQPTLIGQPLASKSDPLDKVKLISVKTRKFKNDISLGSSRKMLNVIAPAYNKQTNTFSIKGNLPLNEHAIDALRQYLGSGKMRRLAGKKKSLQSNDRTSRRIERRVKSLVGEEDTAKPNSVNQRLSVAIESFAKRS